MFSNKYLITGLCCAISLSASVNIAAAQQDKHYIKYVLENISTDYIIQVKEGVFINGAQSEFFDITLSNKMNPKETFDLNQSRTPLPTNATSIRAEIIGLDVWSIYGKNDLPAYSFSSSDLSELCKGQEIDLDNRELKLLYTRVNFREENGRQIISCTVGAPEFEEPLTPNIK
jgi:hypothetical protein